MSIMSPDEFSKIFLAGNLKKFDVVVSFSSLEHSGLGRYGDGLNPWADLIAMAKAWCVVKPEGLALVGVPAGEDMIQVRFCAMINLYQKFPKVEDHMNNYFLNTEYIKALHTHCIFHFRLQTIIVLPQRWKISYLCRTPWTAALYRFKHRPSRLV